VDLLLVQVFPLLLRNSRMVKRGWFPSFLDSQCQNRSPSLPDARLCVSESTIHIIRSWLISNYADHLAANMPDITPISRHTTMNEIAIRVYVIWLGISLARARIPVMDIFR
jgi:hypothetical protein